MSREKIKGGKPAIFNLSDEEIDLIEQLTRAESHKSKSEFIGFIVRSYAISKDPVKEMEMLKQEKQRIQASFQEIEAKEQEVLNRMKAYKDDETHKEEWKNKALVILKNKIMSGCDRFEIEDVARYWSFRLNLDAKELIYLASEQIKLVRKN